MKNEENKIDPEVKKAIWKVIVYAVSVFAALFAGNVSAKCGYRIIPKTDSAVESKTNVEQSKTYAVCIASPANQGYSRA